MICNACSGSSFKQFAVRDDGMEIKQCTQCGLGVVAHLPESTEAYYDDNYYVDGGSSGYVDYSFMAEHGLGWTAALVKLLCNGGRILDIGCADGYLLDKFKPDFEKFGIEVNAKAAAQARDKGITILGNDLLDPRLVQDQGSSFDVVTSIAVFEHLLGFREGFKAAIDLLKTDGFMVFEVPVMSATQSNAAWMQSSFEHIYYPTEKSIRYIVENTLGCQLVGAELPIKDYASTYVGIVTRDLRQFERIKAVFDRVMRADFASDRADEVRASTHLHLLHAGQATEASVLSLNELATGEMTPQLLARIAQLWSFDLRRLGVRVLQGVELNAAKIEIARLKADLEVVQNDARLNAARATEALNFEIRRAARELGDAVALRKKLSLAEARATDMEARALHASARLDAIERSSSWRMTGPIRRLAGRYPRAARRARQLAKVVWWTLQGTILDHTREFMRRRAHRTTAAVHNSAATDERLLTAKLLPETAMAPGLVDEPTGSAWPFDRPLVSVVIPCFNYGHLVGEAIRSVEAQTFQDLEIIVVEGGSSSPESRERLIEAMSAGSPRVRLLIQDKPYRAGANRNFGISHARGKYICCLDADDRLAPTFVEKAVFMLEHSGYDVVSPGLRVFGNKSEVWTPHDRPTLDMLVEANNVVTCAMFRRTYWREAGGYRDSDPATGHIHEDWLFWVRLAALGARFVSIREPLLEYRSHGRTLSNGRSVLENEVQKLQIQRFNADVLTEENLLAARQKSATNPPRPPQTFQHRPVRSTAKHGPTVLLAMPFLILGGAERLLSSVVAHLTKSGWRVIVVTTIPIDQSHGDTTSWFSPSTTEIFHLPRFLDQEYWRDFLNHLVDSRAVDVVWVAGSAFVYDYLPALKLRHPTLGVADLLFNTVGHTTNNRRYADCIDLTFVENREVKQWLLEAGELNDRISLVESGVDLKSYAPAEVNQDFLDSEGIPTGAIVVGYFGRWSDEKDPIGFVEIAKLVSEELDVVFVMTGAGPLDANLQEAIASAKFPKGRFLMKGAVPDIKPYVQACDILVLPSKMDGRPTVVMEALASGVPVVASRVGALPEIFEDGRQGYLCTPGDYKSFAESITELALDERKLTQFKHDARLLAEERLNIQTMLKTYETGLRKLIGA